MLEKTAVDVEAMMVRITADKKEAAATQKAVAQQEQEANEQAAQVCHVLIKMHKYTDKPLQNTRKKGNKASWMLSA